MISFILILRKVKNQAKIVGFKCKISATFFQKVINYDVFSVNFCPREMMISIVVNSGNRSGEAIKAVL